MEGTEAARKSCDLCYRRRMKCDGRKPRCSNCVSYAVECTYAAPSRIAPSKKRKLNAERADRTDDTHNRVERLETVVQDLTERLETVERGGGYEPALRYEEASTVDAVLAEDDSISSKLWSLPQVDLVLPIIQEYIQDVNSVLPLFQGETLLQLVHDTYGTEPHQRDPVAWAAIHVVLALSQRHGVATSHNIPCSKACTSKVESVLSRVVLSDKKLLNVQVLVGMVMLLVAAQDAKPALILIATAIRLAHTIGLHDQAYSMHLSAAEAEQRACVFWLAYILDKDLSMRTKQPSIQIDDDINLDLPSPAVQESRSEISNTDDRSSIILTPNDTIKTHYLTTRVHLAAVQGGVHDYIYSTRSRKRTPEERSRALDSVSSALSQWKASLPPAFSVSSVSRDLAPGMLRFLGALHCASIACTTLINQAHAWSDDWMASVCEYGRYGVAPQLPAEWDALVCEARDLMVLVGGIEGMDCFYFWTTGCSYMTAMVLLVANSMHKPRHANVFLDNHLVEGGLQTVGRMVKETESELLKSYHTTCTELLERTREKCAKAAIMANKADWTSSAVEAGSGVEGSYHYDGF